MVSTTTSTTYPLIQFSKTSTLQGSYKKSVLLLESFATLEVNKLFTSLKSSPLLATHSSTIKKENGFHLELLLYGLNYSSKRIRLRRQKYFVDVHKSEVHICHEKVASTFKSRVINVV